MIKTKKVTNTYKDCDNGKCVEITISNGFKVYIDKCDEDIAKKYIWYVSKDKNGYIYVMNRKREHLYHLLMPDRKGYEIDHIDLDRLNNRHSNLRYCTHQQNQINQPLQCNNSSGYSGVSFYAPRNKYRARIKICHHDIHLGYYKTILEAIQARNEGMRCMFGDYGRYNNVAEAPQWIKAKVRDICLKFANLSVA